MLYINIGSKSAKKFVLRSLGRGLRINPIGDKRQRIEFLDEKSHIDISKAKPLEFLYVFGTKSENLKRITEVVKAERQESMELLNEDLIQINPDIKEKLLLVPEYKFSQSVYDVVQNPKVSIKLLTMTTSF